MGLVFVVIHDGGWGFDSQLGYVFMWRFNFIFGVVFDLVVEFLYWILVVAFDCVLFLLVVWYQGCMSFLLGVPPTYDALFIVVLSYWSLFVVCRNLIINKFCHSKNKYWVFDEYELSGPVLHWFTEKRKSHVNSSVVN